MASLFRPEALAGRKQQWLGSITLIRPLSLSLLTSCAAAAAVAVCAFLYWGEYTRKAHVSGYLVPDRGLIRIMPPLAGTVLSREVQEGQTVRKGDVLFVISLDSHTAAGETQASVQHSLAARERSLQGAAGQQAKLLQAQLQDLNGREAGVRRELAQVAAEAGLYRQRLALGQETLTRWLALQGADYVSPAQVQTKQEEVLALQAQAQGLERQRERLQREIQAIEGQRRELPLRAQQSQGEIDRDLATLTQLGAEAEAKRRIVLRASEDGVITTLQAEAGQMVAPGAVLASLVPAEAQLLAHLYAPSSAVGFLRPEQAVLLRYEAFAFQKFGHQGGRVVQVARTPLTANELSTLPMTLSGLARNEPMYRVTVALDHQSVAAYGQQQALAVGMQLDADVLLERRSLLEWIFEPLLNVARRV